MKHKKVWVIALSQLKQKVSELYQHIIMHLQIQNTWCRFSRKHLSSLFSINAVWGSNPLRQQQLYGMANFVKLDMLGPFVTTKHIVQYTETDIQWSGSIWHFSLFIILRSRMPFALWNIRTTSQALGFQLIDVYVSVHSCMCKHS